MTQQERLNRILEFVGDSGTVTVQQVSDLLNVSDATARRDMNTLAEQRLATRTRGGLSALGSGYELPLQYKSGRQAAAKLAIASRVAGMVRPGASVGMNGGTTTTEVARALGRSDRLATPASSGGITLVTNALNIAYELSVREHVKIVVTGGVTRHQSYELVGPLVNDALASFSLDLAVLGVDGLSTTFGATTLHEGEANASRAIASIANEVIVVADSTKLGRSTFARICTLDAVQTLVTDSAISADTKAGFEASGLTVVIA